MTRFPRFGVLLVSALWLGACAQLIGLSDYESVPEDDDAGEHGGGRSGAGGRGSGGAAAGGDGATAGGGTGATGAAGGDGATGGALAGSGGSSIGGEGGESGDPGSGGSAGEGGGGGDGGDGASGGSTSGGSGGNGGSSGSCTELTELTFVTNELTLDPPYPDRMVYHFAPNPSLGTAADTVDFEFYANAVYNGDATGTFDLSAGDDRNYESCARCIYAQSDNGGREYFQSSGTLVIDPASRQMSGYAKFSLVDVTLVEVDIAADLHSTPVPNGRCLHITSADILVEPPVPEEWTCSEADYRDEACDCGCGVIDPACATSYAGSCDYCGSEGSCALDTQCWGLNVENNAVCEGGPPWSDMCVELWYGDGSCDCGCGTLDVDCEGVVIEECEYCWCGADDYGSCLVEHQVDPSDNSQCTTPPEE